MINTIKTEKAPAAIGPYSQAVSFGGLLFCSGQIPINPASGRIIEGGIEEQAMQVMENVKSLLEASGTSMDRVLKATVFLKDMNNFPVINEIYSKYFISKPARSTVEVSRLPKDVLLEIECIAAL